MTAEASPPPAAARGKETGLDPADAEAHAVPRLGPPPAQEQPGSHHANAEALGARPGAASREGPRPREQAGPNAEAPPPLRVALVGPVAQSIPPARSGSVETATAMLADGLVARGHDVTLFAAASSTTAARLHAVFDDGYNRDTDLWPWELCELFNLAAAVERAPAFDLIHYQAEYAPLSLAWTRMSAVPVVQTVHHLPSPPEVALWSRYPEAPFVAVSRAQADLLAGLDVAGVIHHAVAPDVFGYRAAPDDYLLFLGRFTAEKGVLQAIEVARRTGHRLVLAAADNEYFRSAVAPLVDGDRVAYAGEADLEAKVALLQGARALLYPLQAAESFGLVLIEAMMCGTPVAALDRGAVRELVDEGRTGHAYGSLDALTAGLEDVLALDRRRVRARALERFRPQRMVDAHVDAYRRIVARRRAGPETGAGGGLRRPSAETAPAGPRTARRGGQP